MNDQMKAISQDELGGPEVLELVTLPTPEPGVGEVLVRVHAASVNPVDAMNRESGLFIGQPPFVLGWDVSGTVEAVGLGVTLYAPGDEVFGMLPFPHGHGAHAQYAVGPTRVFVPKPDGLDHVQAAAIPMVGEGSRVLINGAAGGVGHVAVQIAKARGAHVIALASAANADFVRSLGADEVIDYAATDFTEVVGDLDVVLEVIGGDYPAKALEVLRPGGTLVSTRLDTLVPLAKDAANRGVRLAGLLVEADRLGMSALVDLVVAGKLVPTIAATFAFGEAAAAHSARAGPGKVVLTFPAS
jgi:NADPH:quinone reductase-like Zn-dependent oxidoreductase